MVLIMLTGNYGFFNQLTVVLAVSLLSDQQLDTIMTSGSMAELDGSPAATTPVSAWQYIHLAMSFTVVPLV
eukprot:COSAG02_NODE_24313_length_692_cov_0.934233_2_plen_70_part_01